MRMWMQQVQEAYDGEAPLRNLIQTRLLPGYEKEAAQMAAAGRATTPDHAQLRLLADLTKISKEMTAKLADSDQLPAGPAQAIVSRLNMVGLDRMATTLDQAAKLPAPKEKS